MTTPHGAIDLGRLQHQAEAREKLASSAVESFFTLTEENLESHVLQRSVQVPVVVLVGSARSEDSENLKATFQQLAAQGENSFVVGYVDSDTTPQIAQALGVRGVPTVLALAAGRPVTSFEGGQPADMLKQWVDTLVQQIGRSSKGCQGLPRRKNRRIRAWMLLLQRSTWVILTQLRAFTTRSSPKIRRTKRSSRPRQPCCGETPRPTEPDDGSDCRGGGGTRCRR